VRKNIFCPLKRLTFSTFWSAVWKIFTKNCLGRKKPRARLGLHLGLDCTSQTAA
jgi:hypothetical protein